MYDAVMTAPKTIDELINQWPTIGDFATAIGCGYEAARQMRLRNSIAPKHWQNVIEASSKLGIDGVTYEWLAATRAEPQPEAAE